MDVCAAAPPNEFAAAAKAERRHIVRELLERIDRDQRCMQIVADAAPVERRKLWPVFKPVIDDILRTNATWLKQALRRYPLFRIRYAGPLGSKAAWLIVQHADFDPPWQRSLLPEIGRLAEAGDFDRADMAFLVDRVAVNDGELQTYGSQGKCGDDGKWHAKPMRDPKHVDERRRTVGLGAFEENVRRFIC